jgi:hypothetical protein
MSARRYPRGCEPSWSITVAKRGAVLFHAPS